MQFSVYGGVLFGSRGACFVGAAGNIDAGIDADQNEDGDGVTMMRMTKVTML